MKAPIEPKSDAVTSLDECDRALEVLEANPSPTEQSEVLARLVAAHQTINAEIGRGLVLWRARKCGPDGFETEAEVGYPPPHLVEARRFNDNGEPVLYVSTRRETALAEIGAKDGELVHLAGFQVKSSQSLRLASVGEWLNVHKQGRMRIGDSAASDAVSKAMNKVGTELGRFLIYVDAVLGNLLSRPDAESREYITTRLLIKRLYEKLPKIDGLFYPSVKDVLGLNLAIRSAAADRALEGCSSAVLRVKKARRFGLFDYESVRVAGGVNPDGTFQWLEACAHNEFTLYRLLPQEVASGNFPFSDNAFASIP